jgi:hypothetical protein
MANQAKKTEYSGSKKGTGSYWGRKKYAKHESDRKRREDGKLLSGEIDMSDIDNYSYHEALDRTHILLSNLENTLGTHPVILADSNVKELYEKTVENLAELYQVLGRIHLENT